jgi:hypothetical protein
MMANCKTVKPYQMWDALIVAANCLGLLATQHKVQGEYSIKMTSSTNVKTLNRYQIYLLRLI